MCENKNVPEGMILPDVEYVRGTVRKTLTDENGMTYETEEEIEIPDMIHDKDNDRKG